MSIWQPDMPNVAQYKSSYNILEFSIETTKTTYSKMHGTQKNHVRGVYALKCAWHIKLSQR